MIAAGLTSGGVGGHSSSGDDGDPRTVLPSDSSDSGFDERITTRLHYDRLQVLRPNTHCVFGNVTITTDRY